MTGVVIPISANARYEQVEPERLLTRAELCKRVGYEKSRFFELRQLGLPVAERRRGGNLYSLTQVKSWLHEKGFRTYDEFDCSNPPTGGTSE